MCTVSGDVCAGDGGGCVGRVVMALQCLGEQKQWEVRHASLMAVQHLLAARTVSFK